MNQVWLRNFRCFRDKQTVRLTPLTLLVGENSTGKTSFLALIRALWDAGYRREIPDFKEAPYDLGSFDEIAHSRGARTGWASEFEAGYDAMPTDIDAVLNFARGESGRLPRFEFDVTFNRRGTAPVPARSRFRCEDLQVEQRVSDDLSQEILLRTSRGEWLWRLPVGLGSQLFYPPSVDDRSVEPLGTSPRLTREDRQRLGLFLFDLNPSLASQRPFAGAPVRSRPRRTYDPARPVRDPEGESVPMYLSTTFFEDKKSWETLKDALESFGRDAGLFDEISVKTLGTRGTEPFQMHVRKYGKRAKGPMRNLIDVGYGVSQVLPVITELFRDDATPMFLLQQPEVHLHPTAQAALGSLFCRIARRRRQLVIETHSDHLLDRVRMDVRDGRSELKPEDVSILFFERGDLDVRIHSLRLDGEGNVLGAPDSYRRFFMEETRRSLRL